MYVYEEVIMKQKIDFHVHTDFSGDAEIPLEEMVKEAIKTGITDLAITDHVDFDYDPTADIVFWEIDVKDYHEKIMRVKETYKDQIKIYKGIEFGVQPHLAERMNAFVDANAFDYVIGSLHTVDGIDLYNGAYFEPYSDLEAIRHYYEDYYKCATMTDRYSCLGHLDLFLRYKKSLASMDVNSTLDIVDEIYKHLIHNGKGIEVNAGGHKYKLGDNNPAIPLLKRYRELGGEIITLGSDAHTPNYIGLMHDENWELLKSLGFKYICTFDQMKPVFHKL